MTKTTNVPVITIDGPSGTGKGTICHLVANYFNWHVLDSGAIYRVLAYAAFNQNIIFDDTVNMIALAHRLIIRFEHKCNKQQVWLNDYDVTLALRSEQCGQNASKIAACADIRAALLARQRAFATSPGLVTDGRDMGTVVFPDALLKIYLHATLEIRAKRRYLQLKESKINVSLGTVIDELNARDKRDTHRLHAPLKPAQDALVIDTSDLTTNAVFNLIIDHIKQQALIY